MPRLTLRLVLPALLAVLANCPPLMAAEPAKTEPAKPKTPMEAFLEKGRIVDFPERPWAQAFTYNSGRYVVKTNCSQDVAEYVGIYMDAVHAQLCQRFGVMNTARGNIFIFRNKQEMDATANQLYKISITGNTTGFFTTAGSGVIFTYWQEAFKQRPEVVLMHEGTHQFVHAVFRSTLPVWLNEGFAVYYENSAFNGQELDTGRIPAIRLSALQGQMKQDKHVGLEKLFATEQKDFNVDCYGSAWAFVFWICHSGDEKTQDLRRQALSRFIGDCRQNKKDGKQLAGYLGKNSLAEVEKEWKEWVLKLDPKDPYGGTRQKPEKKDGDKPAGTK